MTEYYHPTVHYKDADGNCKYKKFMSASDAFDFINLTVIKNSYRLIGIE